MADQLTAGHLLALAQRLQGATDVPSLVEMAAQEIEQRIGYRSTWLFVVEGEHSARLLATHGDGAAPAWDTAPVLDLRGDPFVEQVVRGDQAVVVEDARTDPRTDKAMVERMGNVSIVNLPLRLMDTPLGVLGMGTFGDEGVRVPTPEEMDYLVQMAGQLSVAASRIRLGQEREAHAEERRVLHERLRAAQRLQSLGLLAGGVAHDFNNLLTVIASASSMVGTEPLSERQRENLEATLQATERAADLVAQLLSMSRERSARTEVLPVADRLGEVVGLVRRVMPRGVHIELEPIDEGLRILGDAAQLDQVMMNLCINARDAMGDGGTLRIAAEAIQVEAQRGAAAPGGHVRVSVQDTGEGIDPELRERIFDPLFSTKQEGGTGLGLSVVKDIVERHGGFVECHSVRGQGTTFHLYFPADDAAREVDESGVLPSPGDSRLQQARGQARTA